ncbi:MAG: porin [Bacteroidales bacterium]|nr:porin [Bacteroidales bacterium]
MTQLKNYRNVFLLALVGMFCYTPIFAQIEDEEDAVNQYGVKVSSFPLQAAAQNNILVLGNQEKGYKFWMDNRVQFDAAHYFNLKNGMLDADGNPFMVSGVSMRRVRMAAKAQINKDWYGEVDLNFANGVFELEDAYVMYSGLQGFEFKVGNFKEDFSMDQTTTSRYSTFMERPMVVQMFAPSRHIGIQAQWIGVEWFRISAGMSWQVIDTEDTRYNVEEFNKQGKGMGTNFTGKAVFMPWGSEEFYGLHIGYNASYRHAKKTDDDRDGATASGRGYEGNYFSTRNATAVSRLKFISTEYYGVKYDYLHGAELAGYKDGFRFQGECIMNHSIMDPDHPKLSNHELAAETKFFWGYYVQASYMLFGGKQRYDVTQSEFTQPSRGRNWGDIEVMARWDYVNLNSKELYGGAGQNLALGLVYHVNNNVKMMLNYQISKNDKYAGNKGRAMIGKDADGNYTAATSGLNPAVSDFGVRFHTIQARIEIDF